MWNRNKIKELETSIKALRRQVRALQYPYEFNVDEKVYGVKSTTFSSVFERLWSTEEVFGKGVITKAYRNKQGFPLYDVYIKGLEIYEGLSNSDIITKKPKKDADTKA